MHGEAIQFWIGLLGWLAVEITLVIAVVAAWQLLTASANRRRIIWQAGLMGAAMLLVFETTGVGPGLAHWALLRLYIQPAAATPAPTRTQPQVQTQPERSKAFNQPLTSSAFSANNTEHFPSPVPTEPVIPWWPGVVWMAGTGLVLAWIVFSRTLLLVFRFRHKESADPVLRERVRILARQLGVRGRVRVLQSGSLTSPIAFGLIAPVIGVPAKFPQLFTEEEQNVMLTHELAHLANHDPAWYLVSDLVVAALWWHPLVWWSRWQIHTHSEIAADEACLILEDGPATLAGCLVAVARRWNETSAIGWIRMAGNGFKSSLGRRVERLLSMDGRRFERPHRGRAMLAKVTGSLALAALAVICTASSTLPSLEKPMSRSVQLSWSSSVAGQSCIAALGTDNPMALVETKTKPVEPTTVVIRLAQVGKKSKEDRLAAANGSPVIHTNQGRQKIRSKLDRIVLPEVIFDGVPLSEAVKYLSDEARRLDPEKKGVNFAFNSYISDQPLPGATIASTLDQNAVLVKIAIPLRNVTLGQAIDAVVKNSSQPLRTSLEDYAVVFYSTSPANAALTTRTFQADPNTFQQGLQNVTIQSTAAGTATSGNAQNAGGGAGAAGASGGTALISGSSTPRDQMLAKLDSIILPEIEFAGVTLEKAIAVLYDESKKADTTGKGINFMINTPLDPNGRATVTPDAVNNAVITITPALRNISLAEAVRLVAAAADQPVKFAVEHYAVVFSKNLPLPPPLFTRVYKVDSARVLAVLAKQGSVSDELRNYFVAIGIARTNEFPAQFQCFLNEPKGLLMIRANEEALMKVDKLMPRFGAVEQPTKWPQPPTNPAPAGAAPKSRGQNNQPASGNARILRGTQPQLAGVPVRGMAVSRSLPPQRPPIPTITTASISAESLHTLLQHPQMRDAVRQVSELYAED
jgi:beta-lactamase regulating signal transducer with metallopeptidase domain